MTQQPRKAGSRERVRAYLEAHGLAEGLFEFEPHSTKTAQQAADRMGCELGQIVKTLVFVVDDADVVVALVAGDQRADLDAIAQHVGRQRGPHGERRGGPRRRPATRSVACARSGCPPSCRCSPTIRCCGSTSSTPPRARRTRWCGCERTELFELANPRRGTPVARRLDMSPVTPATSRPIHDRCGATDADHRVRRRAGGVIVLGAHRRGVGCTSAPGHAHRRRQGRSRALGQLGRRCRSASAT